jgi:hypothetical protein
MPSQLFCAHFFLGLYKIPPGSHFSFLAHRSTTSLVDEMAPKKHLTESQKIRAVSLLQNRVKKNQLHHGAIKEIAHDLNVCRQTISRLWKKSRGTQGEPLNTEEESLSAFPDNIQRKPGSGRPHKYDIEELRACVVNIPLRQRKTIRDIAGSLKLPPTTMYRIVNDPNNGFRRHTSALRPALKDNNKLERVLYAIGKTNGECYKSMEDEVHVDEKWFYLTRDDENYIMLDCEEDPHRSVGHKSHIDKIMFLAATAKPRWDPNRKQMWDGKVGIWPFARREPARRNSTNRVVGTMEWKSFSVDRDAYRTMLIDNVIPAINEKWPIGTKQRCIRIQQDNAPAHIKPDDPLFHAAAAASGLTIQLYNQPPNSPDTNINDLAFFASIQSLQHKICNGATKDSLVGVSGVRKLPLAKTSKCFSDSSMLLEFYY